LFSDKKILFFGAGAIGSFYGGILTLNGYNVTLVARGEHLDALQSSGLFLDSVLLGNLHIDVNAVEGTDEKYDIVFICVKSYDTESACEYIKNNVHKDTIFVSFQNGLENYEIISSYFGENNVVPATVFIGVSVKSPGVVKHAAHGKVTLGYLNDISKKKAEAVFKILQYSKIPVEIVNNIKLFIWKKLIWNAAFNPLSVIFETTCGRLVTNNETFFLMNEIVRECILIAKKEGVDIPSDYEKNVLKIDETLKNYKTSMLLDVQKRKKPEIDGILGAVVRKAAKHNIEVKTCNTILKIILAKYGKSFIYTPKLTVDVIVYRKNELLLIERKNPPFGWALPGGFVDYGEKTEDAAKRELFEETNIKVENIYLMGVYSDPQRDFRMHTVSVVYHTESEQIPKSGDDAKNAAFFNINSLPEKITFDHRTIIEDFKEKILEK
jgi:2-dehydropantoate 2-reductase